MTNDLDELWGFDDPATSEARFRAAVEAAALAGDAAGADEARTQLARALGLQDHVDGGHAVLDAVDAGGTSPPRVRVRSLLERGRLRRSGGDPVASLEPFVAAWELASTFGEDGLAVDAAHMLAIVEAHPGSDAWHARALALAESSPDSKARKWRASLWNNVGWSRFERGDHAGALEAFETALAARRERGEAKETRIAEWCVGRALRALGRVEEALAIQQRLVAEWHAGRAEDAYVEEELGECLLALGREAAARPHLARAADRLAADAWLAEHEPERIARLQRLAAGR